MPKRGAMATTNSFVKRVCSGHWAKQAFLSCARSSEIIAAILVGSVTNFDAVVAGFLAKLIFLGGGFASVSIVWQVTSVHFFYGFIGECRRIYSVFGKMDSVLMA